MLIRGLTDGELHGCADKAKVRINEIREDGRGFRFTIRPIRTPDGRRKYWQRLNHTLERRVHAVCWHGHKAFYDEVFAVNKDAVVITALSRYNGMDDFENKFQDTACHEIGSQMNPCYISEACDDNTHPEYVDAVKEA